MLIGNQEQCRGFLPNLYIGEYTDKGQEKVTLFLVFQMIRQKRVYVGNATGQEFIMEDHKNEKRKSNTFIVKVVNNQN